MTTFCLVSLEKSHLGNVQEIYFAQIAKQIDIQATGKINLY